MPAEIKWVMDSILNEFPQANAFIDYFLVTTNGTEVEHITLVEKILRKLNRENISLKLPKCEFAKRECEWLGHRKTETGVTPLKRKTSPIDAFDFVIEHKPGAIIGIADFLSRHPSEPPKPISQYNNLFTNAKIASIRKNLGFTNDLKSLGKRNHQDTKRTGSKQSRQFSSNQNRERKTCLQTATVEGGKSCVKTPTNRKRSLCITLKSKKSKGHSVYSINRSLEEG